jgi:hypothetical protein
VNTGASRSSTAGSGPSLNPTISVVASISARSSSVTGGISCTIRTGSPLVQEPTSAV